MEHKEDPSINSARLYASASIDFARLYDEKGPAYLILATIWEAERKKSHCFDTKAQIFDSASLCADLKGWPQSWYTSTHKLFVIGFGYVAFDQKDGYILTHKGREAIEATLQDGEFLYDKISPAQEREYENTARELPSTEERIHSGAQDQDGNGIDNEKLLTVDYRKINMYAQRKGVLIITVWQSETKGEKFKTRVDIMREARKRSGLGSYGGWAPWSHMLTKIIDEGLLEAAMNPSQSCYVLTEKGYEEAERILKQSQEGREGIIRPQNSESVRMAERIKDDDILPSRMPEYAEGASPELTHAVTHLLSLISSLLAKNSGSAGNDILEERLRCMEGKLGRLEKLMEKVCALEAEIRAGLAFFRQIKEAKEGFLYQIEESLRDELSADIEEKGL